MGNPNKHTQYTGLFARLVKNIHEPTSDTACWTWKGNRRSRRATSNSSTYPRLNIRTDDGRHKQIAAHRAMLALMDCAGETEYFWQYYVAMSVAEFDCDHHCFANPLCINPDHVQWLTKEEHSAKSLTERHPDQGQQYYAKDAT